MIESLLSSIFTDLPSILGSGAICGAIGWFFGGKQANKNTIDNDSHQREKDFFEIVDSRTEREVKKTIKKVTKCAKKCSHSANCPVIDMWGDEEE